MLNCQYFCSQKSEGSGGPPVVICAITHYPRNNTLSPSNVRTLNSGVHSRRPYKFLCIIKSMIILVRIVTASKMFARDKLHYIYHKNWALSLVGRQIEIQEFLFSASKKKMYQWLKKQLEFTAAMVFLEPAEQAVVCILFSNIKR